MKKILWLSIAAAAAVVLVARPDAQPPTDAAPVPAHHRDGGFQNNHVDFEPRGMRSLLQWQWDAWRNGHPKPPAVPTPRVDPDLAFVHANAKAGAAMVPAVTWIGHATVLAQFGGLNVLTDPIFSERASPLPFLGPKRTQPPGIALADLPRIDLVLVSHNHYDHLDEPSVRALAAQAEGPPLFVVPLGVKAWLAELGITNAVELDWWQSQAVRTADGAAAEVVMTPVQHWSGRTLADRMRTLWGGYAVLGADFQLFHAGDTGYSADFAEIARRLASRQRDGGFDLALLPIGAYEPRWFMQDQHVNPDEALRIHRDLGARRSLGTHWGTFSLTDEPLDEPPRALAAARATQGVAEEAFFVMAIGQTLKLPRRVAR